MTRPTKADLEARIAELEAQLGAECPVCAAVNDGVAPGVRAELALMPDAVKAAPALSASAFKLGERLDGQLLDLAPAPLHAELRNTLAELRKYHVVKVEASKSDQLAARRAARRGATAAAQ